MQINTANLKAFRFDFQNAVKELEEKYGVKIEAGKIGYSSDNFNMKVEVKNIGENGEVEDKDFSIYADSFGLKPEWLNASFQPRTGEKLKIVGINPRRWKNPVELVGIESGKKFKSSADFVKQFMK